MRLRPIPVLACLLAPLAALADPVDVVLDDDSSFRIRDSTDTSSVFEVLEASGDILHNDERLLHTTGPENVFLGRGAGAAATSSSSNHTAFGIDALGSVTTGIGNSAFGFKALEDDNGSINSAFGSLALLNNVTGNGNTAVGSSALHDNTSGSDNVAIGSQAFGSLETGDGNIALGRGAGDQLDDGSDNIYIGSPGVTAEDGRIRIGTDGTHTDTVLAGDLSLGTDFSRGLLTLRGPEDDVAGPIAAFWGDASDQVESGRIRFLEGGGTNWRGAFLHYNGFTNQLNLGVHNANNMDTADDQSVIVIDRNTARVGLNRGAVSHPLHVGSNAANGNGAHVTAGGVWTNGSSRAFKEAFESVDPQVVLEKVAALPIQSWRYRGEDEARHLGPVAEDFGEAFGLGNDSRYIGTVDADGVALSAIQGLNDLVRAQQRELAELRSELHELRTLVSGGPAR